jgi:hypothetical protein
VLDVLPVKVNARVEVDLVGEECAHCWQRRLRMQHRPDDIPTIALDGHVLCYPISLHQG